MRCKNYFRVSLAVISSGLFLGSTRAADIWVAPNGSDQNPGTREQPLATIALAQRKGRELRRRADSSVANGVHIFLRNGMFRLDVPLLFRPEDSGTETAPTSLEAAPNEHPVLSGGIALSGWRKLDDSPANLPAAARGKVWFTDAPRFGGRLLEFRQLWVNDRKATRARTPADPSLARLLEWDRAKQETWIPAALVGSIDTSAPNGLEMIVYQQWEIAVLRVKTIDVVGERARLSFQEPEGRLEFEHPWPQPVSNQTGHAPFFLANAIGFLDQPGEWFQQMPTGRIYYWPREGEDLPGATVIAPVLETLITVDGTLDRPVSHLEFKGLRFAHTTWMRPSLAGHVPLQAGMFMLDAYKLSPKGTPDWHGLDNQEWTGRPPGVVSIHAADKVRFERCQFEHLASAGLDVQGGTHDSVIEGCTFRDVGGNGIQLGYFSEGGFEAHVPYNPSDVREISSRNRIANNLVTDCANEDWGGVGIGVGYAREIAIEHNEVNNLSYTGISLGWGWTRTANALGKNLIRANSVHHVATRMGDTAGIYLLSAQPGTVVSENSVHDITMSPYPHDPEHWFYLYLDEGSSFITVRDNWCPAERFLKNANGPGNIWERNGPTVPAGIKESAGLERTFRDLLELR